MRVMLVSDTGFQYLAAVIPAMEKRGVAYSRVSTLDLPNTAPKIIPRKARKYYYSGAALREFQSQINAFRPDLIHITGVRSVLMKTLIALRPHPEIALIYERISTGGMNPFNPIDPMLFGHKRIDRLVMPSMSMLNNWMGNAYMRRLAPTHRNEVLHYAFDLPPRANADEKRVLRESLGLDPAAFIIGTVCHIRPWKAPEFVAEAVKAIKSDRPIQFAVVGGPNKNETYMDKVRTAGGDRLKLLGYVPEAHRVMAAFDLYVTPTRLPGESFGMAFAEAMAHGVPGITFNYGASAEVCDHGFTGYALPENMSVWRRHIEELMNDEQRRLAMGEAARERIATHFSPEARAEDYYRVYTEAIEERSAAGNAGKAV